MHRVKVAAAVEKKTVKQMLFDLAEAHLQEMEKMGYCRKKKTFKLTYRYVYGGR